LLIAALVPAVSQADPAQEVRCREAAFSQSVENRDAVAFASFIDPDARFIASSVARGIEEIVTAWQPFLTEGGPAIKWRSQFVEVLEEGKLALSRGPYRLIVTDEQGDTIQHWGTFNSVWRLHEDGVWRVVFDAGSAPPETPTDEQKALLETESEDCPPGNPG
jgi:ketosteroid isomerase-like protein